MLDGLCLDDGETPRLAIVGGRGPDGGGEELFNQAGGHWLGLVAANRTAVAEPE